MRIEVLDFGYVEFVEAWGTGNAGEYLDPRPMSQGGTFGMVKDYECGIVEAARQSTQGSFRGWDQDAKLLKHLYDNKHATPFEFAGMVIEVQAPIFVFREWHRHRTQSYNEMSARYEPLPDLYYLPTWEHVAERGAQVGETRNKQASGTAAWKAQEALDWWEKLERFMISAESLYQDGLAAGVPKELARITMPVGHYSRMRASANLRNWLAFMTLRCDPRAQYEIQQYAGAVATIIGNKFPRTHELWWKDQPINTLVG